MKKSKLSYFLSVPLLLLVLLLVACTETGVDDGLGDGGGGGEPGVGETTEPLPGLTEEPAATEEAPAITGEPGAETAPAGAATIQVTENPELGPILTDGEGMTLYLLEADEGGDSTCYDACVTLWPPFTAEGGDPQAAAEPVDAAMIGATGRTTGETQVTYNDHPLYYYASDTAAGDVTGHGVQDDWGLWLAVTPEGEPVPAAP